jgi:hypothetical protein
MKEVYVPKILCSLVLVVLLTATLEAEADISSCGCRGMRNVKNRLCEARAAIQEYDRISSKFLSEEKKGGKPILLTSDMKANIKLCVKEALDTRADADAQDAKGETEGACNITVKQTRDDLPPSKCIEESVRRHEEFHRDRCKDREEGKWQRIWSSDAPLRSAMDTKFAMSAVDYMAEEHAAYMMEEAELRETLRRLANTCKKEDKVVTVNVDDQVPGMKKGDKYNLDLSIDPCPSRSRISPSDCKY